MTKRKSFLSLVLLLVLMVPCAFLMTACGDKHTHNFDEKYSSDAQYHWYACDGCSTLKDREQHIFNVEIANEKYLKSFANCNSPATYFKSCVCGMKGEEVFQVGEKDENAHVFENSTYDWSSDNTTCVAHGVCAHNASHTDTDNATITSEVTQARTCENDELTTYTATFAKPGFAVQTKTAKTNDKLGHDYGEATYTWSENNTICSAERVCSRNPNHKVTEQGIVSSVVTTPQSCENDELITITATFTNAEHFTTQTIENVKTKNKLGHEFSETWSCSSDETCHCHACLREGCLEEKDQTGHNLSETRLTRKATATEKGLLSATCFDCGYVYTYETLETTEWESLLEQNWSPETATTSLTIDYYNNGLHTDMFKHTFKQNGEYYSDSYQFGFDCYNDYESNTYVPQDVVYLRHITSPSSPIQGYSLYTSSTSDRYVITDEQFNEYLDRYFKLSSIIGIEEDLYNKTNVIALYGENAYYYDIYAVQASENIIQVMIDYTIIDENGLLDMRHKAITFRDGVFSRYNEVDAQYNRIMEIRLGDNIIDPLPASSTPITESYSVFISSPYEELDAIIASAFTSTVFPSQNNAVLNFINIKMAAEQVGITIDAFNVYFDNFSRRIDGEEDDIRIPYSNDGQIFIEIDATKANAEKIDLNVNILGDVSVQTFEIFGEGLTYADFSYQVDYDWSLIPMDKGIIGFNTDINATEALANNFILTEGTTVYAIFYTIPKITIRDSKDNSINTVILVNDPEMFYEDEETGKIYCPIDYNIFYSKGTWLEGLFTSINCLPSEEIESITIEGEIYYLMTDAQVEYFAKINQIYFFYIDGDMFEPTFVLKMLCGENEEDYYDTLLALIREENTDENITIEDIYTDRECTQKWSELDLNGDICLFTKKTYAVDDYVITLEQDLTENISTFVVYDLKKMYPDFYVAINYLEDLFYYEGIYVYGFYTDAECTQEWNSWPTGDITIYVKPVSMISISGLDSPIPFEMIEYYYYDELTGSERENYRHLSLIDYARLFLIMELLNSDILQEDEIVEDFYLDSAFTQRFNTVPTKLNTQLYAKIVPEIIISFDGKSNEYDYHFKEMQFQPQFYKNFDFFKNTVMLVMADLYDLTEGVQEIAEIYLDAEKTKPLITYPTESCTLYVDIAESIELLTLDESEKNSWRLKAEAPNELPLRAFFSGANIYNIEDLIEALYYYYEGDEEEVIDYIYYLNEENEEVKLTSLPNHAITIYIAVKAQEYVNFDNSVATPNELKMTLKEFIQEFPLGIKNLEEEFGYFADYWYEYDIDYITEGLYIDPECTQKLTDFPTGEITLYVKRVQVPVIRFAPNEYCYSCEGERLSELNDYYDVDNLESLMQFIDYHCGITYICENTHEIVGLYLDAEFKTELTEFPTESCTIYIKVDRIDYGYYYAEQDEDFLAFVNMPIDMEETWYYNFPLFNEGWGTWTVLIKSSEVPNVVVDVKDVGSYNKNVHLLVESFVNGYGHKPTHFAFQYTPNNYYTWEYIPGEDDWFEITYLEWIWGEELDGEGNCTLTVNLITNGVATPIEATPNELNHLYIAPKCTLNGKKVFNATVTIEGVAYTSNNKSYEIDGTDLHDWYDFKYTWTDENTDHPTCVAKASCRNSASHKLEETAVIETTYPTAVTCELDGKMKHTATFTNPLFTEQTKEITLISLGHSYTEQRAPEQGLAIPATCNAKAKYKYFCANCGDEEFGSAHLYEYGEPLTHQFGYVNEGEHECSLCHIRKNHEFNEVTGQCICGYECPYTMGLEFTLQGDAVYYVSLGTVTANTVVIPNMYLGKQVTRIADEGFKNATNLTEITIGKNITEIGQDAFVGCTNLSTVNIYSLQQYSAITFVSPTSSPFYSSQAETHQIIVSGSAFSGQMDFGSHNFQGVKAYAFYNYKGLTTLKTGIGMLAGIGESAFEGCINLVSIDMSTTMYGAGYLKTIGARAFKGCTSLTTITNMNAPELQSIGESAFEGCSSLSTGVKFNATIKSIGKNAFKGCDALTSVTFVKSGATWVVTDADNEENTAEITVDNTTTNATNLKTTYLNYSWELKEEVA